MGESRRVTGKPPISVRWVDVNKGDNSAPNVRSRLVARQIRQAGEAAIFAPTPPLEVSRSILSIAATDFPDRPRHVRDGASERRTQVSTVDISRAYVNAPTDESCPTYVMLPPEDPDHRDQHGFAHRALLELVLRRHREHELQEQARAEEHEQAPQEDPPPRQVVPRPIELARRRRTLWRVDEGRRARLRGVHRTGQHRSQPTALPSERLGSTSNGENPPG